MTTHFLAHLNSELEGLKDTGLYKSERVIASKQAGTIALESGREVINLCANNYLGLSDNAELIEAGRDALARYGYGMSSVRFICGTQEEHIKLESRISRFLGFEDTILYSSCFDANAGLFETLLGPEDAIISDALNHASIIDGIRLCKAKRYRYANSDMADLEAQLQAATASDARFIMIATDGVFSMDGTLANLPNITKLAEAYSALVMVDDCHSTGFMGPKGKGTPAHFGVDVDILTGTLGKALGGAIGGYVAGPQPVIDLLRQRARPYLFSNSLPPSIVAAGIEAIRLVEEGNALRAQLFENAAYWRAGLTRLGFDLLPGEHPIIPVMLGEAHLAQDMAARLFDEGVYVSGFFFPVVPRGQARIRTQMNASLTKDDLDRALTAFETAGKAVGVLK